MEDSTFGSIANLLEVSLSAQGVAKRARKSSPPSDIFAGAARQESRSRPTKGDFKPTPLDFADGPMAPPTSSEDDGIYLRKPIEARAAAPFAGRSEQSMERHFVAAGDTGQLERRQPESQGLEGPPQQQMHRSQQPNDPQQQPDKSSAREMPLTLYQMPQMNVCHVQQQRQQQQQQQQQQHASCLPQQGIPSSQGHNRDSEHQQHQQCNPQMPPHCPQPRCPQPGQQMQQPLQPIRQLQQHKYQQQNQQQQQQQQQQPIPQHGTWFPAFQGNNPPSHVASSSFFPRPPQLQSKAEGCRINTLDGAGGGDCSQAFRATPTNPNGLASPPGAEGATLSPGSQIATPVFSGANIDRGTKLRQPPRSGTGHVPSRTGPDYNHNFTGSPVLSSSGISNKSNIHQQYEDHHQKGGGNEQHHQAQHKEMHKMDTPPQRKVGTSPPIPMPDAKSKEHALDTSNPATKKSSSNPNGASSLKPSKDEVVAVAARQPSASEAEKTSGTTMQQDLRQHLQQQLQLQQREELQQHEQQQRRRQEEQRQQELEQQHRLQQQQEEQRKRQLQQQQLQQQLIEQQKKVQEEERSKVQRYSVVYTKDLQKKRKNYLSGVLEVRGGRPKLMDEDGQWIRTSPGSTVRPNLKDGTSLKLFPVLVEVEHMLPEDSPMPTAPKMSTAIEEETEVEEPVAPAQAPAPPAAKRSRNLLMAAPLMPTSILNQNPPAVSNPQLQIAGPTSLPPGLQAFAAPAPGISLGLVGAVQPSHFGYPSNPVPPPVSISSNQTMAGMILPGQFENSWCNSPLASHIQVALDTRP